MRPNLKVESFAIGSYACNCSIIYSTTTHEALVIDPGNDPKTIMKRLATLQVSVKLFLHTHAHFDHIGGSKELRDLTGAPIYLHKSDELLYKSLPMQSMMFGLPPLQTGPIDHFIQDGEEYGLSDPDLKLFLKAIHTPGHTSGSCSFYTEIFDHPLLFAGDTLFQGSVGRTDLPGGDFETLKKSIKNRLYVLPKETMVITGHGPSTTIADEGRDNPFVSF